MSTGLMLDPSLISAGQRARLGRPNRKLKLGCDGAAMTVYLAKLEPERVPCSFLPIHREQSHSKRPKPLTRTAQKIHKTGWVSPVPHGLLTSQ